MLTKKEIDKRFSILNEVEYLGNNKVINNLKPLVSVSVATYQHENYIKECLEGILMQQTNFDFEIVIGEDESKDQTRELCIEYAEKFPDKIRLFLRNRELTATYDSKGNFFKSLNGTCTYNACRGKYVALCEGDDYWTDPLKLQKQVDFLEVNEEYAACFHNATIENSLTNESYLYHKWYISKEISVDEAIVLGGYVYPTASIVFRKIDLKYFNINAPAGDLELLLNLVKEGRLYYFLDIMCVYRRHESGVYSGLLKNADKLIKYEKTVISYLINKINDLPSQYQNSLKKLIRNKILNLFKVYNVSFVYLLKVSSFLSLKQMHKISKRKIKQLLIK